MIKMNDFKAKVIKIISYVQTHCCSNEQFDDWVEENGSWRRFEFKKDSTGSVEVFYGNLPLFKCDSNNVIIIDTNADLSLISFLCD